VGAPMKIETTVQAPGFEGTEFQGTITIEPIETAKPRELAAIPPFKIMDEKSQKMKIDAKAPDTPGEYKVTVKVIPHADETNKDNNEISTYIHVGKEKTNILWIDRPRVYEPKQIIQLALAPEKNLNVEYIAVRPDAAGDPIALYKLDQPWDVIVIGDISAKQF